jgi:hippurate hydrolase
MKRSLSPCVAVSISSRRSAEEHQTSDEVARLLAEWGYEVHRGLAGTGVVGSLTVGSGQRRLGLRADMDALPMQEASGAWASQVDGRFHGCGHDGHTTTLCAASIWRVPGSLMARYS